ncbi:putative transcription factor [Iris pallida]|uniref:Transcription factor n=1 Tax=Iris pallida TaxID=29817 RepID=A0AAX6F1X8_IRIPA|nr:putative transcription factor [Iris pallida]
MAAAPEQQNHAGGFDDDEDDLDDTEDSDMDDYEEDDDVAMPAPPTPSHASATVVADPAPSANPNPNPNPSQPKAEEKTPPVTPPARVPAPASSLDDSRKLFQRLWTDDDEIKILKGFLEFTSSRGTTFASHQYDTGPFYEQIKNQLQLDFNKSQLIEKLRRLKKKYRNTAARMASHGSEFSFKNPHEQATYDIARKIWSVGSSFKRSRESDDDLNPYAGSNNNSGGGSDRQASRPRKRGRKRAIETIPMLSAPPLPVMPPVAAGLSEGVVMVQVQTAPAPALAPIVPAMPSASPAVAPPPPPAIPSIIEETVKSCLSPIFKELMNSAVSRPLGSSGSLGFGPPPVLSFWGNPVNSSTAEVDEKWKKQYILELEVYLKRVELVREQIKTKLEELKLPEPAAALPATGS